MNKLKMIVQFFWTSIEGDFAWSVSSYPVQKLNCEKVPELVWKTARVVSSVKVNGKPIQILYGVCDGASHSTVFFNPAGINNWVTRNTFNDDKPHSRLVKKTLTAQGIFSVTRPLI